MAVASYMRDPTGFNEIPATTEYPSEDQPSRLTPLFTPLSGRTSTSTLSRQDDLLRVPEGRPDSWFSTNNGNNEERLNAFPFPPQRSPTLGHIIDDLVQIRENQQQHQQQQPNPVLPSRPSDYSKSRTGPRQRARRAATVLSLIDELAYIGEEDSVEDAPVETATPIPHVDDRYKPFHEDAQLAGLATFQRFETRMRALDRRLLAFHNAVRHLGSSVGLYVSAVALRARLGLVLHSFRQSSSIVFPALGSSVEHYVFQRPLRTSDAADGDHESQPDTEKSVSGDNDVSADLELLATDLEKFLEYVNQISEFNEEGVNVCITSLVADLRYWGSSLHDFHNKRGTKELVFYIHDLTEPLGEHLVTLTSALSNFVEVGTPTIRLAQQQTGSAFLNLSTVSTLLSGVTASTLQISTNTTDRDHLKQAVNLFWIVSLVFSIASAINSQMAYYWLNTKFRSPRSQVPWWGFMVITQAPLYFLIGSVIAFSAGLVCFAFSAFPSTIIPLIASLCTGVTLASLVAVIFWLSGERWAFSKSRGTRWFISFTRSAASAPMRWLSRVTSSITKRLRSIFSASSLLPRHAQSRTHDPERHVHHEATPPLNARSSSALIQIPPLRSHVAPTVTPVGVPTIAIDPPSSIPRLGHEVETPGQLTRRKVPIVSIMFALRRLVPSQPQLVQKHTAPILCLAFSPDGKTLASGGWDRNIFIWKFEGETLEFKASFPHPPGAILQVCWSPGGSYLMGRMRKAVVLWRPNDESRASSFQTIQRPTDIQSLTWLNHGNSFISVEDSTILEINTDGNIIASYDFPNFAVQSVAVTKDGDRMIVVGTLEATGGGLSPSKSPPESRIMVYNTYTRQIEDQIPILRTARHVTISNEERVVLVTYDQKAPQLLRLSDRHGSSGDKQITVLHDCHSQDSVEPVCASSIGSLAAATTEDQIVFGAGKEEIWIWERESGRLLGSRRSLDPDAVLMCAAWNHSSGESLIFAAGTNEGNLRLWRAPMPQ